MTWFRYRQNNTGGVYDGPALEVWIEADDDVEADSIAEADCLYFDGVDEGIDCDCCGDRWYRSHPTDGDADFDMAKTIQEEEPSFINHKGIPNLMFVPKEGKVVFHTVKENEK